MKKTFFVFLFIFISFVSCETEIQQCLKSFLKEVGRTEVTVKEGCMGDSFLKTLDSFKEYIEKENHVMIVLNVYKVFSEIKNNCPTDVFSEIYKNISAQITDGSITQDIYNKAIAISKIFVAEYKSEKKTPESVCGAVGKAVGKFYKKTFNFLE